MSHLASLTDSYPSGFPKPISISFISELLELIYNMGTNILHMVLKTCNRKTTEKYFAVIQLTILIHGAIRTNQVLMS